MWPKKKADSEAEKTNVFVFAANMPSPPSARAELRKIFKFDSDGEIDAAATAKEIAVFMASRPCCAAQTNFCSSFLTENTLLKGHTNVKDVCAILNIVEICTVRCDNGDSLQISSDFEFSDSDASLDAKQTSCIRNALDSIYSNDLEAAR
jgi:hypothetical protein